MSVLSVAPGLVESAAEDLAGNIKGSMSDTNRGFLRFFASGMKWTGEAFHFDFDYPSVSWYQGEFTGPMADLRHLMRIPANEMQNLADVLKSLGFGLAGKFVQHLANPLNTLADGWHLYCRDGGLYAGFKMDAPLAMLVDLLGAPILSMEAFEDSIQDAFDDLMNGHLFTAGFDLLATPVNILHAFLFGEGYLQLPKFAVDGTAVDYAGAVHLGGIFAPLGYGQEYVGQYESIYYDWAQVLPKYGTLTGGLVAALVSTLPPKLQDPLSRLGCFLDGTIARPTGHSRRP